MRLITIHDGYDIQAWSLVRGRATKTWPLRHWTKLVHLLKAQYSDFKIVQLGHPLTARTIPGVKSLVGKTTLSQALDVLAASSLHIDGCSGLVHAATRMGVHCVVMFGPTPANFYGYPQNTNLTSNACAGGCYWLEEDWMKKCPIGFRSPICMDEITPQQVMEAVQKKIPLGS